MDTVLVYLIGAIAFTLTTWNHEYDFQDRLTLFLFWPWYGLVYLKKSIKVRGGD
jgi:hypothetical protein